MRVFVRMAALAMAIPTLSLAASALQQAGGQALQKAGGQAQAAKTAPATTSPPAQQQKTQTGQQKTPAPVLPASGKIKKEVPLVDMVFSVLNKKDRFVTDLASKDFEIFDNNVPQQIAFFSREANLPLRIGILLDTSNSIHSRLEFEKNAAFDFLFRNIRPGEDLAFVMTFDTHPQLQQGFTDNMDLLRKAIFSQRAGGGTALCDAIYDASRDLINAPLPASKAPNGDQVRRVLVVFSDGIDDLSNYAPSTAIDMAERAGVAIYTISTNQEWVSPDQYGAEKMPLKLGYTEGDRVLREFADETGGRPFYPYRVSDLAQAFADIGTELRSQYSISFYPSYHAEDGKFHQVDIELLHEKGLKVRTRQGYWAEKPPPPSPGSGSGTPQH